MIPIQTPRRMALAAAVMAATATFAVVDVASAQGVDRYQFLQLEKQVEQMQEDVTRLRNALSGGNLQNRINSLEDEISRLTGQIERLQFQLREFQRASKVKLEDLEYRIIELEGGDPSILFQQDDGANDQGALSPSVAPATAPTQPSGGTLGVITTTASVSGGEKSLYDDGVAAVRAGQLEEGREILSGFVSSYPNSALAGDAHFWLGESHYRQGDFQAAANRFLDGATLFPGSPMAAESLFKLGVTLNIMGQRDVACSTLREVGERYPQSGDVIARAEAEASRESCG